MLWLSAVLIAWVSNLDNLAVGFAFGMRERKFAAGPNAVIAAITMAGTAVAMSSGHVLSRLMSPAVASALGSSIIIGSRIGWSACRPLVGQRASLIAGLVLVGVGASTISG